MSILSATNRADILLVLGEYGYTLSQSNCIEQLPKYGSHCSNLQVTQKNGRFQIRIGTPDGQLLFSCPRADGMGDFLQRYWYKTRVTQS